MESVNIPLPSPLSHAYVITGGNAERRRAFGERLAAAWLCTGERPPCGVCPACRKVSKGIHPDVTVLSPPEGKREIAVGDARELRRSVYIRPNEGRRKVCLVDPADALNPAAQNALLKVLEDGPAYAAFALLCEQPGKLLETVRSRCETILLPPEEEPRDPALAEKGADLARLLLGGDEMALARRMAELEREKPALAQVLELLAAAEEPVTRALPQNRRAVTVLRALKRCRETAVYNPGGGHLLGWLCTELFK